jgi:hypothetical protein
MMNKATLARNNPPRREQCNAPEELSVSVNDATLSGTAGYLADAGDLHHLESGGSQTFPPWHSRNGVWMLITHSISVRQIDFAVLDFAFEQMIGPCMVLTGCKGVIAIGPGVAMTRARV